MSATPVTTPGRLGRLPGLDGLRGAAVLAVILYHFPTVRLVPGGWVGVDLFFVLSGFLITALLLEEHSVRGRIDLRGFYRRRLRRLGPAAAFFLTVWVAVGLVAGGQPWFTTAPGLRETGAHGPPVTPADLAIAVFAAMSLGINWLMVSGVPLPPVQHLWSLAVEEQFYLLWPPVLALLAARRRSLVALATVTALISAALPFLLWNGLWGGDDVGGRIYVGTDTRIQALLAGALLAIAHHAGVLRAVSRTAVIRWGVVGAGVLLGVAAAVPDSVALRPIGSLTVFALAGTAVVGAVVVTGGPRMLSRQPLQWLGRRSYALYLWNYVFATWTRDSGWLAAAAGIALSLLAADVSWRLVERRPTSAGGLRLFRRAARSTPVA